MLKLLYFLPCEKFIESKEGPASLVGIVEHLTIQDPRLGSKNHKEKIPQNAAIPFSWTAVVLWRRISELRSPAVYNVEFQLLSPKNKVLAAIQHEFTVTNEHLNFRNTFEVPFFPIANDGIYNIRLKLKKLDDLKWRNMADYPIQLIYTDPEKAQLSLPRLKPEK